MPGRCRIFKDRRNGRTEGQSYSNGDFNMAVLAIPSMNPGLENLVRCQGNSIYFFIRDKSAKIKNFNHREHRVHRGKGQKSKKNPFSLYPSCPLWFNFLPHGGVFTEFTRLKK
jgi:hypothetical protein